MTVVAFNYILVAIFCLNAIWWLSQGLHWTALYWLSAASITFAVTKMSGG